MKNKYFLLENTDENYTNNREPCNILQNLGMIVPPIAANNTEYQKLK